MVAEDVDARVAEDVRCVETRQWWCACKGACSCLCIVHVCQCPRLRPLLGFCLSSIFFRIYEDIKQVMHAVIVKNESLYITYHGMAVSLVSKQ